MFEGISLFRSGAVEPMSFVVRPVIGTLAGAIEAAAVPTWVWEPVDGVEAATEFVGCADTDGGAFEAVLGLAARPLSELAMMRLVWGLAGIMGEFEMPVTVAVWPVDWKEEVSRGMSDLGVSALLVAGLGNSENEGFPLPLLCGAMFVDAGALGARTICGDVVRCPAKEKSTGQGAGVTDQLTIAPLTARKRVTMGILSFC